MTSIVYSPGSRAPRPARRLPERVLETLAALKGRCAMLVVEQNRTVLEHLADRVLVMRSGHLE